MRYKRTIFVSALALGAVVAVPASAEIVATAMTPLNVRSGPGPEYSIIDTIPDRGQTTIIGCIRDSLWCQVSHKGRQGWAYSQYLTARLSGRSLAVAERLTDIPTVVYQTPVETVGSAVTAPAITGTLVAGAGGPNCSGGSDSGRCRGKGGWSEVRPPSNGAWGRSCGTGA